MNPYIIILCTVLTVATVFVLFDLWASWSVDGPLKWRDDDLIEYLLINKSNFTKNPLGHHLLSWVDGPKIFYISNRESICAKYIISFRNKNGYTVMRGSPLEKVLDELYREAKVHNFNMSEIFDDSEDPSDFWKIE